ncbi:hypothetical protein GCM10027084_26320 [Pseudoxanthomonas sangjuensis]|uniref:hypothetical protein n=1 Tax=Pseudoxanthomonas sangjuensis TaxID=1503750 RepID=UPI0013914637|nr:hypothetical protein [Pseudoxanthomonas sangjuensis]
MNSRTQIYVALIGAAAIIGAALIPALIRRSPDEFSQPNKQHPSEDDPSVRQEASNAQASRPSTLAVTGVLIGTSDNQPFVTEARTRFKEKEEIAVTVRYNADQTVANFPVRLSTRIVSASFGGVGNRQTTDISVPGASFWTFRLRPEQAWAYGQNFISVSVDGQQIYSQEIDVGED